MPQPPPLRSLTRDQYEALARAGNGPAPTQQQPARPVAPQQQGRPQQPAPQIQQQVHPQQIQQQIQQQVPQVRQQMQVPGQMPRRLQQVQVAPAPQDHPFAAPEADLNRVGQWLANILLSYSLPPTVGIGVILFQGSVVVTVGDYDSQEMFIALPPPPEEGQPPAQPIPPAFLGTAIVEAVTQIAEQLNGPEGVGQG